MSGWRSDCLECLIRSGLESIKFCTPDMTMRIQHQGAPHVLQLLETFACKVVRPRLSQDGQALRSGIELSQIGSPKI
jgi:hypothetical protein